jgi:hypothetical protein
MAVRKDTIQIAVEIEAGEGVRAYQALLDETRKVNNEMHKLKRAGKENSDEFKALQARAAELNKEMAELGGAGANMQQLINRSRQLNQELKQLAPGTSRFIEVTKELQSVNSRLAGIRNETKAVNASLIDTSAIVSKLPGPLGQGVQSFQNMTKQIGGVTRGFGAMGKAWIATGFGAIVVLITALIEYFTNFQKPVEFVTKLFNTLAGTVNAIVANASKLLSLDFLGFFKGVAEGAQDAWEQSDKLFAAQNKLYELNKKFTVENAQLNAEIERLGRVTRDTTLSAEERLAAQEQLDIQAEKLIENERLLTEAELERLKAELALENNYKARLDLELQIEQSLARLIDIESKVQAQRDRAAKAQRAIIDEEDRRRADEQKKRQEDARRRAQEAERRAAQAEAERQKLLDIERQYIQKIEDLEDETEEQRLARERQRSLEALEALKGREEEKARAREQIIEFFAQREAQLAANRAEEAAKAEEERAQAEAAAREKARLEALQAEDAANRLEQDRLANLFLKNLLTEQQYEDQRFEQMQAAMERRLEYLRMMHGEESAEFIALENQKLEAQKKYEDQRAEYTRKTEEARQRFSEEGYAALGGFIDGTIELLESEQDERKKNALALKGFAIGKVLIDTEEAIMAIIKNAQANPANILFPGAGNLIAGLKIAGVTARSTAAINRISRASFARGGFTGDRVILPDAHGGIVGGVHKNEWVAPAWQVKDPRYAPVISWLENARKNSYVEGGFVGQTSPAAAAATTPALLDTKRLESLFEDLLSSNSQVVRAIEKKQFAVMSGQIVDALDEEARLNGKAAF